MHIHMTDHAGPRRAKCNPGAKLWNPLTFVTRKYCWRPFCGICHPMSGFGARLKIFGTRFQILVPVLKKLSLNMQFWHLIGNFGIL